MPEGYRFDPADPRAPSNEQWDQMSPAERARVVAMLPTEDELDFLPEGDAHFLAKSRTRTTLDDFFRRVGRKIYVSSELGVYYPNEPRISPDILAVLDVELRERDKWVVREEGRGIDLAIEVHYAGNKAKDYEVNVERYARLGIREYFIFDRRTLHLRGYRLSPEARAGKRRSYAPIVPQAGLFTSEVLGLDLTLEGSTLRFFYGMAPVPEAEELVGKLQAMVDELHARNQESEERADVEAERADAEAERARAEAEHAAAETARAALLERQIVTTRAEALRLGIEAACELLEVSLTPERRAHLDALDAPGLEDLLRVLRTERRFP